MASAFKMIHEKALCHGNAAYKMQDTPISGAKVSNCRLLQLRGQHNGLSAKTGNYHRYRSVPNTCLALTIVCYWSMGGQRVNKRRETIPSEPTGGIIVLRDAVSSGLNTSTLQH